MSQAGINNCGLSTEMNVPRAVSQVQRILSLLEQGLDVPDAHPPARRLLAREREDLVGEVDPMVEEPPAAVGVGAVEHPHVVR